MSGGHRQARDRPEGRRLAQRRVSALLLGDVAADRGRADDGARRAPQWGDRERHLDARAVLPEPRGLVGLDVFAAL